GHASWSARILRMASTVWRAPSLRRARGVPVSSSRRALMNSRPSATLALLPLLDRHARVELTPLHGVVLLGHRDLLAGGLVAHELVGGLGQLCDDDDRRRVG